MGAVIRLPREMVQRKRVLVWVQSISDEALAEQDKYRLPESEFVPGVPPELAIPDGNGGLVFGFSNGFRLLVAANSDPARIDLGDLPSRPSASLHRAAFRLALDSAKDASRIDLTRRATTDLTPEPNFLRRPGSDIVLQLWTREQILERFTDLEAFLSCWDGYEQHDDRYLVHTGLEIEDDAAFAAHIREQLWRLARITKPGHFRYYAMKPKPFEEAWWQSHPSHLSFVTVDREGVAEFSSAARQGDELAPRDISAVRDTFRTKTAPDGTVCTAVRVVFAHEEAALRERVPLMDCGAHVFFLDSAMQLQLCGEPSASAEPKKWVKASSLRKGR